MVSYLHVMFRWAMYTLLRENAVNTHYLSPVQHKFLSAFLLLKSTVYNRLILQEKMLHWKCVHIGRHLHACGNSGEFQLDSK